MFDETPAAERESRQTPHVTLVSDDEERECLKTSLRKCGVSQYLVEKCSAERELRGVIGIAEGC